MIICPYCKQPLKFNENEEVIHHVCTDGFSYYILKKEKTKK